MKSKVFIVILFSLLLSLPFSLTSLWLVAGKRIDFHLSGYFGKVERPSRKLRDFLSGENQKRIEKFLRAKICPRGFFIKFANQIQFSLFRLGKYTVGKHNDLIDMAYINSACGLDDEFDFSLPQNQKKVDEYVAHLQSIQQKLQKLGKTFIFYTSLSKGVENYDDIPFKYRFNARPNLVTGYDYLKSAIAKTGVNYLDSRDYIGEQGDAPLFYTTGHHWSRPIEQVVSKALVEKMAALSGKSLPQITLGELHSSKTPFRWDIDYWNNENIFQKFDCEFFEYEAKILYPPNCKIPKIFLQGDSFGYGLICDYDSASDNYYCFYDENLFHQAHEFNDNKVKTRLQGWQSLNLQKYLDECDFFIVESSEARLSGYSSGFVEYFDKFLDGYAPLKNIENIGTESL